MINSQYSYKWGFNIFYLYIYSYRTRCILSLIQSSLHMTQTSNNFYLIYSHSFEASGFAEKEGSVAQLRYTDCRYLEDDFALRAIIHGQIDFCIPDPNDGRTIVTRSMHFNEDTCATM